jgi:cold shock CspA family protein
VREARDLYAIAFSYFREQNGGLLFTTDDLWKLGGKTLNGKIKFVDVRTEQWGYIVPDDGSKDIHFWVSDATGEKPSNADAGAPVEFDLIEDARGRHARSFRLMVPSAGPPKTPSAPQAGDELKAWAFVPYIPFRTVEGIEYNSVLEYLAGLALKEEWHFGEAPDPRAPFPILDSYLTYSFSRLRHEGKVLEKERWATFNTGLVDRLYDPMYALFDRNDRSVPRWRFFDFGIPGKRIAGKRLTAEFDPLPEPAKYFGSDSDMIFDTSKDIHVDTEHVILDGISRDRFPSDFLREHLPEGFEWRDVASLDRSEKSGFLAKLSGAIEADARCMRLIKRRLEDAKFLAEKRIRWNFKTAIPQYYPRFNLMSFLLPLALINDEVVDMALVVTRNQSGSYLGSTILPLNWAYKNARLVCRPDSDWLAPTKVQPRLDFEKEEALDDSEPE